MNVFILCICHLGLVAKPLFSAVNVQMWQFFLNTRWHNFASLCTRFSALSTALWEFFNHMAGAQGVEDFMTGQTGMQHHRNAACLFVRPVQQCSFFKSYSEVILNITITDLHLLVLHVQYSLMIY